MRRLGGAIPTLFIIIAGTFFMMRLAPGGPFARERVVPPEVEANLMKAYHLDEPLWQQFLRYLNGLAHGDFGPSFKYKDFSVADLIFGGFPVSLQLGGIAILLALAIGLTLGIWAALRQNSWIDYATMSVSMVGIAVPNFVKARDTAMRNACVNNLREMDAAKELWALENKKDPDAIPTGAELDTVLKNKKMAELKCLKGGTYSINSVGQLPTCSIPTHELSK